MNNVATLCFHRRPHLMATRSNHTLGHRQLMHVIRTTPRLSSTVDEVPQFALLLFTSKFLRHLVQRGDLIRSDRLETSRVIFFLGSGTNWRGFISFTLDLREQRLDQAVDGFAAEHRKNRHLVLAQVALDKAMIIDRASRAILAETVAALEHARAIHHVQADRTSRDVLDHRGEVVDGDMT